MRLQNFVWVLGGILLILSSFVSADYYGDCDGDGVISAGDYGTMITLSNGGYVNCYDSDGNLLNPSEKFLLMNIFSFDDKINSIDVEVIRQILQGNIPPIEIEEEIQWCILNNTYSTIIMINNTPTFYYDFGENNTLFTSTLNNNYNWTINLNNNVTVTNNNDYTIVNSLLNNLTLILNNNNSGYFFNYNNITITNNILNDILNINNLNLNYTITNNDNTTVISFFDNYNYNQFNWTINPISNTNVLNDFIHNIDVYINDTSAIYNYNNINFTAYTNVASNTTNIYYKNESILTIINNTNINYFDIFNNLNSYVNNTVHLNEQLFFNITGFYDSNISLYTPLYAYVNNSFIINVGGNNFTCNMTTYCGDTNITINSNVSNSFDTSTFGVLGDKLEKLIEEGIGINIEVGPNVKTIGFGFIGLLTVVVIVYLVKNKNRFKKPTKKEKDKTTDFKKIQQGEVKRLR